MADERMYSGDLCIALFALPLAAFCRRKIYWSNTNIFQNSGMDRGKIHPDTGRIKNNKLRRIRWRRKRHRFYSNRQHMKYNKDQYTPKKSFFFYAIDYELDTIHNGGVFYTLGESNCFFHSS